VDVLEIDAASNRGIDEIRDLKEKVRYLPAEGKYKVYIIDEVHMLTTEAFNALLKTLEEPPAHVIFLLATTEPHKLPATILSRCQRFDFRRLSIKEISERLRKVADAHQISTNDGALILISRYAEGAMRDALGLLEQAASFGDNVITEKDVLAILGAIDEEVSFRVAEALVNESIGDMIKGVNDVINSGKDPKEFLNALILHFRSLLIVKTLADPGDLVGMADSSIEKARQQAELFSEERLLQIMDMLTRVENEIRWAILPRITVETTLLRLLAMGPPGKTELLEERMAAIEKNIARLKESKFRYQDENATEEIVAQKAAPDTDSGYHYQIENDASTEHFDENPILMQIDDPGEDPITLSTIKALWAQVLEKTKKKSRSLHSFLLEGKPLHYEQGRLTLGCKFDIHKEQIEKRENRLLVEQILQEQFQEKMSVICQTEERNEKMQGDPTKDQTAEGFEKSSRRENLTTEDDLDLFGGRIIEL